MQKYEKQKLDPKYNEMNALPLNGLGNRNQEFKKKYASDTYLQY